jgi:hypothetical protein
MGQRIIEEELKVKPKVRQQMSRGIFYLHLNLFSSLHTLMKEEKHSLHQSLVRLL